MSLKNIIGTLLLMAVIVVAVFWLGGNGNTNVPNRPTNTDPSRPSGSKTTNQRDILGGMLQQKLIYTDHAKCRMKCRTIDRNEVREILQDGDINWRKSKPDDPRGCPTYAVEGPTDDGQTVRIVFAACDNVTKVITTIDLDRKYDCYCK